MHRIDYALLQRLAREELPEFEAFITSDMSLSQVDALQGAKAVFKKLEDLVHPDADRLALEKFFECNEVCRSFALRPSRYLDDELVEMVTDTLERWLHPGGLPIGLSEIFDNAALGSGANIKSDSDCFYTKLFDSPLSATHSSLYVLYRTAISRNPTWARAEKARSAIHGEAEVIAGSITTVPKQFTIKRTVITEAVLNMFFERGLGLSTDRCLEANTGINLSTQPDFNRELARRGSIDGSFATIDLRSASDLIALLLCKRILPRYYNAWLERLRLAFVRRPNGQIEELFMISSMGNGFTFSLQTIIFAAIVFTCYNLLGIKVQRPILPKRTSKSDYFDFKTSGEPGNFGVFGDDIVVRREAYHFVCHALSLFGFVVNADKSFNTGDFRESCGSDFWRGHPVRGVYIKNLKSTTDCYSAINRLIRWSSRTGVCVDFMVAYLASRVRFLPIPPRDGDSEGIKVPFSCSMVSYYSIATRSLLYRARVTVEESWPVPEKVRVDKTGKYRLSKRDRKKIPYRFSYNPDGIIVSLVGGFIRDGRVTISRERDRTGRSKVLQRTVPYWDYHPAADSFEGSLDGAWSRAVEGYLTRITFSE